MAKQLFAAEISHENAPSYIREKLALDASDIQHSLQSLRAPLDEVFVLSAANRFIVYAVGDSIDPLLNFFLQDPELIRFVQFYRNSEATLNHLFATAAGLCSPVRGEYQIIIQLGQAHKLCTECGTIGLMLDHALREAIRVGKKIRTETGIDHYGSSIVDAGFELLYEKLERLYDRQYLVIGNGKLAHLALSHLKYEGIRNVVIVSHDMEHAIHLASEFGVKAISMESMGEYFSQADVVIGSTQSQVSLCEQCIEGLCPLHNTNAPDNKKIILDFGMPRNFSEKLRNKALVQLYNLDDLKPFFSPTFDIGRGIEEAWKMVGEEVQDFLTVFRQLEYAPILAGYWNRLLSIKNIKSNQTLSKFDEATPNDVELMKKCAHRLIRTISREPLKDLQAISGDTQAPVNAEVKILSGFRQIPISLFDN